MASQNSVANVRTASGVSQGRGPDDAHIGHAIDGFVRMFDFWYARVMREAVPNYRKLIIQRINPFIRRMQCNRLNTKETAAKLVADYDSRNFVTAGGWAIERMALSLCATGRKSPAEGIDIERADPTSGDHHLYVVKSGSVTRNADILNALKRNARRAEKLLQQSRTGTRVIANYAVAAGKTSTTFEDGIRRPSSAEFWSEITDLPQDEATRLALAVALESAAIVQADASVHTDALQLAVATYIAKPGNPDEVDWDFLARRTLDYASTWAAEDEERHSRAMKKLRASGYSVTSRPAARRSPGGVAPP